MPAAIARWLVPLLVLFTAVLIVWIRLRFLEIPLGRNEGAYGYLGAEVLRGSVPFRDFYEMKPLGLYFSYALFVGVFGQSSAALHLALLVVNAATAVLVYLIAARWWRTTPALVAALTFGFLTLHPPAMGLAFDAEHLINLFAFAGIYVLGDARGRHRFARGFAAGALVGCAAMIKQIVVVLYLPMVVWLWWSRQREGDGPSWLVSLAALCSGAAAVGSSVLAYHLATGSLGDAIYWMVEYPSTQYGASTSFAEGWTFFQKRWASIVEPRVWIYLVAAAGVIAALVRSRGRDAPTRYLVLLFLVSIVMLVPGLRFYGHYWLWLAPSVSLAVGLMVETLIGASRSGPRAGPIVSLALVALVLAMPVALLASPWNYLSASPTGMSQRIYAQNPFPEIERITREIRARIKPGDEVVVFGSEPQAYLQLEMQAPTPHVFLAFLSRPHARRDAMVREFEQQVAKTMPRFAVVVREGRSWMFQAGDGRELLLWGERFVSRHYRPILIADMVMHRPTRWIGEDEIEGFRFASPRAVVLYERLESRRGPMGRVGPT